MLKTFGINHKTAPIEVREQFALNLEASRAKLGEALRLNTFAEGLILSTCNRTEIYTAGEVDLRKIYHLTQADIRSPQELKQYLYFHKNIDSVRHTFTVASGLDSMVLGEHEILGQMKTAYQSAKSVGAVGKNLSHLFESAFRVAKVIRSNTAIGKNPISVAYAAVRLALQIFAKLDGLKVLLLGAGQTINLTGTHLQEKNITDFTIANRTLANAQEIANKLNAKIIPLGDVNKNLENFDIIITATSSEIPLIGKGALETAIKARKHKPMFLVDLGVPRDIEPQAKVIDDIYLYSVDDLQSIISENRLLRLKAKEHAQQMIEYAVEEFYTWQKVQKYTSNIVAFRDKISSIKQTELEKAFKLLDKGHDPKAVLEIFSHGFANKLMHAPTVGIKKALEQDSEQHINVINQLFEL